MAVRSFELLSLLLCSHLSAISQIRGPANLNLLSSRARFAKIFSLRLKARNRHLVPRAYKPKTSKYGGDTLHWTNDAPEIRAEMQSDLLNTTYSSHRPVYAEYRVFASTPNGCANWELTLFCSRVQILNGRLQTTMRNSAIGESRLSPR